MSKYSNVTEQVLINLRKLAEQQKDQRSLKIKNRILKPTHDVKLAESLSPVTKKLDEVKKSTQKTGEIVKESNIPRLAIENTNNALPIENEQIHPGVIYDTSLENMLNIMKNNIGFFNIDEKDNGDNFSNGFPVEKKGGNKIKVNEKIYEINSGIQKVLIDTSNIPLEKLNDKNRVIFTENSESLKIEKYKEIRGESKSCRYKQSKLNFEKHILEGQLVKLIIPSNIIDIYTRLEILIGLKLSGHRDTLTEASNLIHELHKRGKIQIEQQYRNAQNKFKTQ